MLPRSEVEAVAVIPAYNEANTVRLVAQSALRASLIDAVVVVDDGSTDQTSAGAAAANTASSNLDSKPFEVLVHDSNQGKTEALVSGIERAKQLGSTSLSTLVLLDADSSPIWSRDTAGNMKLWQTMVHKLAKLPADTLDEKKMQGREDAFTTLLARYIDEIAEPVTTGQARMSIGMYERNVLTDTVFTLAGWGGHAGNRAISVDDWDAMMQRLAQKGVEVHGWEIEAGLNSQVPEEEKIAFIMRGVVNVGSRKKTGSLTGGIIRMMNIHGRAVRAALKFK